MAESTLSIDINSLRKEVGVYLGWGRELNTSQTDGWSATNYADYEYIQKRALRWVYFPPTGDPDKPFYEWSFLRKNGTITLVNTNTTYDLPDDFGGTLIDGSFTYAAGTDQYPLIRITDTKMRRLQRTNRIGFPKYYSYKNKAHDEVNGQRYSITFHPTPGAAANTAQLTYRYVYVPNALTNTNKYPVGGAQYSELFLAAHLAAAEAYLDDDPAGPYRQQFNTLLGVAMRNDEAQKSATRNAE